MTNNFYPKNGEIKIDSLGDETIIVSKGETHQVHQNVVE